MFSPYYAWARRADPHAVDPLDHCAVNVALYGGGTDRWAMTERGAGGLRREPTLLQIGPSSLRWQGDTLTIDIDEITAPWPSRLRGTVRLHARQRFDHPVTLAEPGGHRWFPMAPHARVEVDLSHPRLCWAGPGYLDANRGDEPLERGFRRWNWTRAQLSGRRSVVLYDLERADGEAVDIGLAFDPDGGVRPVEMPCRAALPASGWRLPRATRCDANGAARVLCTLTDAPFYARSLLGTEWLGEPVTAMHESLSLQRFDSRWVQAMLPFRMPRRAR